MDRVAQTETPEWRKFEAEVRSGFDTDDWKNNIGWTRTKYFDSQVSCRSRKCKFKKTLEKFRVAST